MKRHIVRFSGHRPEKFDFPLTGDNPQYLWLPEKTREAIPGANADGYDNPVVGMAGGFDLIAAMVYLESKEAKRIPDNARLIAVVPFKGHRPSKGWLDIHREVSEKADEVITVANKFSPGAYPERNRLMVDRSSRLIRYRAGMTGGTAHTVNHATNKGLKIIDLAGLIPKGS